MLLSTSNRILSIKITVVCMIILMVGEQPNGTGGILCHGLSTVIIMGQSIGKNLRKRRRGARAGISCG